MKQVFAKKGKVEVEDVTEPVCGSNQVKVKVHYSAISIGTELGTIRKVKQPLYRTALEKKELTKKVLKKAQKEGYLKTYKYARQMISSWWPLGYSCSGEVIEVGRDVADFSLGDRVACGGQDYACHAEVVCVPKNLVVRIPERLDFLQASHTTICAIAMQGVRRLNITFGESVVVYGLGLLGQISSQILTSIGCRVIGIDIDKRRAGIASAEVVFTENPLQNVLSYTGIGADAVLIAAASDSAEIINNSLNMCRRKGRVVMLGNVPMNIMRDSIYKKELDFFVSTSYGPGRYDADYEEGGHDYPIGYVRWTENRNMQEVVRMISERKIDITKLVEKEYPIENAAEAYRSIEEERPLSAVFSYPRKRQVELKRIDTGTKNVRGKVNVALVGVGNFAKGTHLPNVLKIKGFHLKAVVTKTGGSAKSIALRNGADFAATNIEEILKDKDVHAVIISTRHDSHASLSAEALMAGKHVLVEKPMGLNREECDMVRKACKKRGLVYSVGFNRNYSPLTYKVIDFLRRRDYPIMMNFRVNTKPTGKDDWVNDPKLGGGRIVGEMCHMYSFFNFVIGSPIESVKAEKLNSLGKAIDDNNVITTIKYRDGSVATLFYTDFANDSIPKERIEIFGGCNAIVIDDFESLNINGKSISIKQDKGHYNEILEFMKRIRGEDSILTDINHAYEVMDICFKVQDILRGRNG